MLRPYPFNAPPASCRQRRGDPRPISTDQPKILRSALETEAGLYSVGAWHGRIPNRRIVQERYVVPVIFVGQILHPELDLPCIVRILKCNASINGGKRLDVDRKRTRLNSSH